jgi:nucleoside-diphosphate-sugar epimerase
MKNVLITGAAGNLGSRLARHLLPLDCELRLMYHHTPLPPDLASARNVRPVKADLASPETLKPAVAGADVAVHFAGRLFAPRPATFLAETNTRWFANLVSAAIEANVGRVILMSFPHVEGPTSPDEPATGRLDRQPISIHAQTRLDEERLLFARTEDNATTTPVVLRLGMIYGKGILMIEAARWLAERRLLCVWKEPTLFQLLSTEDFLRASEAAIFKPGVRGIYHVGDDRPVSIQEFLDAACRVWGCRKPTRIPYSLVYSAACVCEGFALVAGTASPLTRDFVCLGRVSHWGDTRRAREELIPELRHPTLESGLSTL